MVNLYLFTSKMTKTITGSVYKLLLTIYIHVYFVGKTIMKPRVKQNYIIVIPYKIGLQYIPYYGNILIYLIIFII